MPNVVDKAVLALGDRIGQLRVEPPLASISSRSSDSGVPPDTASLKGSIPMAVRMISGTSGILPAVRSSSLVTSAELRGSSSRSLNG